MRLESGPMSNAKSEAAPLVSGRGGQQRRRFPILLMLSVLLVLFNRVLIPTPALDWLNLLPAAASAYIVLCLVAPRQALGHIDFVARCVANDAAATAPRARFLLSPWVRSSLLLPAVLLVFEFLLRCGSYHRTVYYERQGDLLFTPSPNQEAVEKISLTPSRINELGLRGATLTDDMLHRHIILCLGDSITYGYGVDDDHTYPAQLQHVLDREYPGQFTVLNGGVNAYPMGFIHQKFLYLWRLGIHPDAVIVGYSMNEGWLGDFVESDAATKDAFARRVRLKNVLRSSAIYNLVVENWGIDYYERVKGQMVPGTHTVDWSEKSYEDRYGRALTQLLADVRARNVKPVFLLFSAFDGQTGRYDAEGFLQKQFASFAASHEIPVVRNEDVFRDAAGSTAIEGYFRDRCHMNEQGSATLASRLAALLPGVLAQEQERPSPQS